MDLLTIVAGVASVIGCVVSICQACKAKKSANKAEAYKNMVFKNTVLSDVSQVSQKLSEVETVLKEYKRSQIAHDKPKGRNKDQDNKLYDDALSLLNKKMPMLPNDIKNKVEKIYKQLSKNGMLDDIPSNLDNIGRILRHLSECQLIKTFEQS